MPEKIKILKVRFDIISLDDAVNTVIHWTKNTEKKYVTTPNPEIILEAQKNHKYLKILNKSNLNIADGTGVLWAARYLKSIENISSNFIKILKWIMSLLSAVFYPPYIKNPIKKRVTGTDLMQNICKNAPQNNTKIFLLGARKGIAEKAKEILEKKYTDINITGTHAGTPKIEDEKEIIKKIDNAQADILFVAYGAPKQEIWISRNLKKLRSIKVAIGVGGAFDFIAGKRKRAPKWMRKIGLEWLYRLIQQPSRIKRILNATIKFPIKILKKNL